MSKTILKIYDDSKNYTCQVIKLPPKQPVKGLDNLVEVNVQGNSCLVLKDYPEDELYFFFPAECEISEHFLSLNNLYRHQEKNADPNQKGYFEDTGRVKAQKFKGIISSGFVIPVTSFMLSEHEWEVGDEFNEVGGMMICKKYVRKRDRQSGFSNPRAKVLDEVVDSKLAPEHPDTSHLLKNIHKLAMHTRIVVSVKLHGTSARTYHTIVKRKLNWKERIARKLGIKVQTEEYDYVVASRRTIKSVGFEELPNKNHYFTEGDLWSEVAKNHISDKLNKGEAVYYEIVGKTYGGQEIQANYSYGFDKPEIFVYRITNINPQGIEVDLPYEQMKERATQLGLNYCPEFFTGTLGQFIEKYATKTNYKDAEEALNDIFYNQLLEKPSMFDKNVVEEGFCVRIDKYGKPDIFKIKSKKFLEHETKVKDKELADMEEEEAQMIEDEGRNTD